MRTTRLAFIGVIGVMLLGAIAAAQSARTFNVGDEVQFEFLGDWTTGTIFDVHDNGWYYVRFERRGKEKESLFPPSQLREPGSSAPEKLQLDQTVEFDLFGDVYRGTVVEVGELLVTVRYKRDGEVQTKLMRHDRARVVKNAGTISITPSERRRVAPGPDFSSFVVAPRRDETQPVDVSAAEKWHYRAVDAGLAPRSGAFGVELPWGAKTFTKPGLVAEITDASGPGLLVSSTGGGPRPAEMELERMRLSETGLVRGDRVTGPRSRTLVSAARDGSMIALADARRSNLFVEIFRLNDDALAPWLRIEPKTTRPSARRPWAAIVGSRHAVTELGGTVELWNLESGSAEWSIKPAQGGATFVDAARRHLFVPQKDGTVIVEIPSGRAVGALDTRFDGRDRVAIRHDGRRIAWLEDKSIVLMDLVEKPSSPQRLALPAGTSGRTLAWLDTRHVIVGGELVFDVTTPAAVGRVDHDITTTWACAHGMLWTNADGPSMSAKHVLAGRSVEPAREADANVLERGRISVHVDTGDEKIDKRLRKQFAKRLDRMGLDVARDGSPQLVVGAEPAASEKRTYSSTIDGDKQERTVSKIRWSVTLVHDGETHWQTGGLWEDTPMIVSIREGQTLDDAMRGKTRPLEDDILDVQLPTFVGVRRLEDVTLIRMPAVEVGTTSTVQVDPRGERTE